MKNMFKRCLALFLASLMAFGCFGMISFADGTENKVATKWYGDNVAVDITAGTNGYTFISVYQKPYHAYEMSNHMVSTNGGVDNDIPQLLIMADASKDYTWTPNGIYNFANSNYEILYCCDAETGYDDGIYYIRKNLEDSDYYDVESAAHIRAIVTNSYPYVSLEQMKKNLEQDGFEGADQLTRAEIITAVQSAIWAFANVDCGEYYYSQTFDVPSNSQWGGVMHDYTAEMNVWWQTGKRKFSKDETVAARINALIDYLKALDKVYAEKEQIVISNLEILNYAPVIAKDNVFTVALQVALNNSGSSNIDDIKLDVYVDGKLERSEEIVLGTEVYNLSVEAMAGQTIKAVVSGKQTLPSGVYFYEPVGGRDVSQCAVGVASGETNVYAEASVIPELPEEKPVTADLDLMKVNYKGVSLTGATFDLYKVVEGVDYIVGTYKVDANGCLKVEDLLSGDYKLVEVEIPTGFAAPEENVEFSIDEDGVLTVKESKIAYLNETGTLVVKNEYKPVKITLSGIKYLDDELAKDFAFTLSYNGQIINTVFSDENGIFNFGELFFNEEGSYVYIIDEIDGTDDEIYYDESVYTVYVEVTEKEHVLEAVVTVYRNDELHQEDIVFNNQTIPDIPDNPPPLTGDGTTVFVLVAIVALALAVVVLGKKRLA